MEAISSAVFQREDALRRHQELLQELQVKRLQEKLLQVLMGSEARDETGMGFYIDQLALQDVSQAEKSWLKAVQTDTGAAMPSGGVYDSLNSVIAAFNSARS